MTLCTGELGKIASESPEAMATTQPRKDLVLPILLSLGLGGLIGYLIAKGRKKSG
jgi:hypothetical protein